MELDDSDYDIFTEYEKQNEQKNKVKKLSNAPKSVRDLFNQKATHASVDSDEYETTDETGSEEEAEDEDVISTPKKTTFTTDERRRYKKCRRVDEKESIDDIQRGELYLFGF